jgi:hypothetical protein
VIDDRGSPPEDDQRRPGLSAVAVNARLAVLREISVVERDGDARARLERDKPRRSESFALAVERRLRELHALCALASYVHRSLPDLAPAAAGESSPGGSVSTKPAEQAELKKGLW